MGEMLPAAGEHVLVILESPYAGDVEANVDYARQCVRDSLLRDEAPIASHLLYTQPGILNDDVPAERERGIAAGLAWGVVAQYTVVYTDRGISRGMRQGIENAKAAKRPVIYRRIELDGLQLPSTILAERVRQELVEGYDASHDDQYDDGNLAAVGTMYYQRAIGLPLMMTEAPNSDGDRVVVPVGFPWDADFWKPKTTRRDLERAGALFLAEVDRLRRLGRKHSHVVDKLRMVVSAYTAAGQ